MMSINANKCCVDGKHDHWWEFALSITKDVVKTKGLHKDNLRMRDWFKKEAKGYIKIDETEDSYIIYRWKGPIYNTETRRFKGTSI